ncbi:MAG: hypothetical protein II821_04365 [Treponema sp.]|nr:hypothetical protein [Treponema sp.]
MNEKIMVFFSKVGMCLSAAFLFVLGFLLRDRFQNKGIGTEQNLAGNGDIERNRERAEHAYSTISEIIRRVKERGGEPEEENSVL